MATVRTAGSGDQLREGNPWWANKVAYRVDLRLFNDSTGDGIGDLDGLRQRLGYLELLEVELLWLTGLLASPVGKPEQGRDVDPLVGDTRGLEILLVEAHAAGMRVVIDLGVSTRGIRKPGAHVELGFTLRQWMDLGIDGLRIAAPGFFMPATESTHEIVRLVRPVVDEYQQRLVSVFLQDWSTRHGLFHEIDVGITSQLANVSFDAVAIREVIRNVRLGSNQANSVPAWALVSWEAADLVTAYGGGEIGLARARAMALVQCALPGIVGLNNGQELGLSVPEPPSSSKDASLRGLIPWEGSQPPFGFSSAADTKWAFPEEWSEFTVQAQLDDPSSTLSLYRRALDIRREHGVSRSGELKWYGSPAGCLAFRYGGLTCALNTTNQPVQRPPGEFLLSSTGTNVDDLPANSAIWLR